jgi:hypothetical protein
MKSAPLINKWKQKLIELDMQQDHLIIMDNDDEMLSQCLQEKQELLELIINDIQNI